MRVTMAPLIEDLLACFSNNNIVVTRSPYELCMNLPRSNVHIGPLNILLITILMLKETVVNYKIVHLFNLLLKAIVLLQKSEQLLTGTIVGQSKRIDSFVGKLIEGIIEFIVRSMLRGWLLSIYFNSPCVQTTFCLIHHADDSRVRRNLAHTERYSDGSHPAYRRRTNFSFQL